MLSKGEKILKNRKLDQKIVKKLMDKTSHSEKTIRNNIAKLRADFSGTPINSVAQIYARKIGISVHTLLTPDEKSKVPNIEIEKPIRILQNNTKKREKKTIIQYIRYKTKNPFIQAHVDEVNMAYTFHCYTAAFILCRKIIENLLIDLIRKKYPKLKKEHVEIYFDTSQGRLKDFSIIIDNLHKKASEFGPDKKLLERILNKSKNFKDDANDKTHSWYHIVKYPRELDEKNVQDIINMISILEGNLDKK